MTDKTTLSLIERIKSDDMTAFDELSVLYSPLVDSASLSAERSITAVSGGDAASEAEDLRQEARLALYKAALSYDPEGPGGKVTFGLFAKICIRNAMASAVRREKLSRRRRPVRSEYAHEPTSGEAVSSGELDEILSKSDLLLSGFESSVLRGYLSGKPAREIARELGRSAKSVSNAIFRIKTKLKTLK